MSEPTFQETAPASLEAYERLQADVKRLLAENEGLRLASDWQPIETAPTDGTMVLVYAPATDPAKWAIDLPEAICTAVYHEDAGWCICTVRDVTHWRPLPNPPTPPTGDAP